MHGNKRARSIEEMEALLEEGRRAEQAGVLDRADAAYREVAESATVPRLRGLALLRRSHVHRTRGLGDLAIGFAREGRSLAREAGEDVLEAELVNAEGGVHRERGDLESADALFREMLALTSDARVRGVAFQNLAANAAMRGDFADAERCFGESSELFLAAGYRRGEAFALNNRGRALLDQALAVEAQPVLERAERLAAELGDLNLQALARLNLAEALLADGALDEAERYAVMALGYFTVTESPYRTLEGLRLQGDICARRGEAEHAAKCYRRAQHIAAELGATLEEKSLGARLDALGAP